MITCVIGDTNHTPTLHILLNCLDYKKSKDNTDTYGVVYRCPDQEVLWQSNNYLLDQDYHWVSRLDFFHTGLRYKLYLILNPTFGCLISCNELLGVHVLVIWGKGDMMCLIEIIMNGGSR